MIGWISDSYCSLKPLCSGMGEVVPARTSPTLLYPVSKCCSASIVVTCTLRVKDTSIHTWRLPLLHESVLAYVTDGLLENFHPCLRFKKKGGIKKRKPCRMETFLSCTLCWVTQNFTLAPPEMNMKIIIIYIHLHWYRNMKRKEDNFFTHASPPSSICVGVLCHWLT